MGARAAWTARALATALSLAPLMAAGESSALARQCVQPAATGCPLEAGQAVDAAIRSPEDAHNWWIDIPADARVRVALSNLAADYRLYIYGPSGALVAVSNEDGTADEVIVIPAAEPGRHQVFVDSPRGATSPSPYRLVVNVAGGAVAAPLPPVTEAALPPGTVLFEDNFTSPGLLSRTSDRPEAYLRGYVDGEYQIRIIDPTNAVLPVAYVPGTFVDSSIALDVRVLGEPGSQSATITCRRQAGENQGSYRLFVNPENRTFRVLRFDGVGAIADLARLQTSEVIRRGNAVNHLELTCAGTTITASINGVEVASAEDDTYPSGRMWFGPGASAAIGEVRFDNVVVAAAAPRSPLTPAPPAPGAPLLADDFRDPEMGWFPRSSTDPALYERRYLNGEYQIRVLSAEDPFIRGSFFPTTYANASLAVDARVIGDEASNRVLLECRRQPGDDRGSYRLHVNLATRSFSLVRLSSTGITTNLAPLQPSAIIRAGNLANRVELSCAGTTIEATINNALVASVEDDTYSDGRWWFGTGNSGVVSELRFDNLVLTQR